MSTTFKTFDEVVAFRKALGITRLSDAAPRLRAFTKAVLATQGPQAMRNMARTVELALSGNFQKSALPEDLSEFLKAYESNSEGISDVLQLTQGQALTMQALDATMVSLVQTEASYTFLNTMAREDVAQTFLEYNQLKAYRSSNRPMAWVGESSDPGFDDPIVKRAAHNIAFMSGAWSHSRVLPTVRTTENPESLLQNAQIHNVLETFANGAWYGNRSVNKLQFNGFVQELIEQGNVYDAEGTIPAVNVLKGITQEIRYPGHGLASEIWTSVATKRIFDNYIIANNLERAPYGAGNMGDLRIGAIIPGLHDENAKDSVLRVKSDIWLNRYAWDVPRVYNRSTDTMEESSIGINPPNRPAQVTVANAGPVVGSKWKAGDVNTLAVRYRIVAKTDTGMAAASEIVTQTGAAVGAGEALNIVITPDSAGFPATAFEIWRETKPQNGIFKFVVEVIRSSGATTTYQDINEWRPGTEIAILGDFNSVSASSEARTYCMAILLPMMATKFPPGVGTGLRRLSGMVELYAGLRIKAPSKFWLIKNLPVQ